jgi:hypothetical protein
VLPYSLTAAFNNIKEGRTTISKGLPSVVPIEGGGYYVWDGYHRLAAMILKGQTKFYFVIETMADFNIDELPSKDAIGLMQLSQVI